jgi:hypothetical protein
MMTKRKLIILVEVIDANIKFAIVPKHAVNAFEVDLDDLARDHLQKLVGASIEEMRALSKPTET